MDARRITVAVGGLLVGAFGSAAVAFADSATFPDVPGQDAFTIGGVTFDPLTYPATTMPSSSLLPPLTTAEGWNPNGSLEFQNFMLFGGTSSAPSVLGAAQSLVSSQDFFGIQNTEIQLTSVGTDPVDVFSSGIAGPAIDPALPTVGTIYDVLNFGLGFENVYRDIPGLDGAANAIADEFVTPFGVFNIPTDIDYFALDPGDAFTGIA